MKRIVILDPGHGGWDPINRRYTTSPSKQFKHKTARYHNGRWYYEGVGNRLMMQKYMYYLGLEGVPFVTTIPNRTPWIDVPLKERVDFANRLHRPDQGVECFFYSIHSNASNDGKARGFEIYTSPGDTESDKVSQIIYEATDEEFQGAIRMRPDLSDGDHDKEEKFFVLTRTRCPAALGENLYFDNVADANLLMTDEVQHKFARAAVKGLAQWSFGMT